MYFLLASQRIVTFYSGQGLSILISEQLHVLEIIDSKSTGVKGQAKDYATLAAFRDRPPRGQEYEAAFSFVSTRVVAGKLVRGIRHFDVIGIRQGGLQS